VRTANAKGTLETCKSRRLLLRPANRTKTVIIKKCLWFVHDVPRAIKHSPQYFQPINSKFSSYASSRQNTNTITPRNHANTKLHYRRADARRFQRKHVSKYFHLLGADSTQTSVSQTVFRVTPTLCNGIQLQYKESVLRRVNCCWPSSAQSFFLSGPVATQLIPYPLSTDT
jgi:hypothetical protein